MRICLVMIVKNEAHIIERALDSARPMIDSYCILDTGSTDGTRSVIRKALDKHRPGRVIDVPWEGFGPTRTRALVEAKLMGNAQYALILDADDYLEGAHASHRVGEDLIEFTVRHDNLTYRKPHLLSLAKPWRYVGRTHEFLDCAEPFTSGYHSSPVYVVTSDGARRKDAVLKTKENIEALLLDVREDKANRPRWTFYLAQEYKDAGDLKAARGRYQQRADMTNGWDEERWRAQYEVACLLEYSNEPPPEVEEAYHECVLMRPQRAEPLVDLARFARLCGTHSAALVYARAACHTPLPQGERFFLDQSYYGWRRLQELGLALHNTGQHAAAIEVFKAMFKEVLPQDVADQTEKNIYFCEAALRR
jgi:glycosyltransferase involved in cell wall biosynthesis